MQWWEGAARSVGVGGVLYNLRIAGIDSRRIVPVEGGWIGTFPTVDPGYDEALRGAGVAAERWPK